MGRNWFALAAAALMFVTVASSLLSPWWRVEVGSGLLAVNVDPFLTSFSILGTAYIVPIILALNVGTAALFIAGGIALIIYAINPAGKYSKHLLSFGWKRPLQVTAEFIVMLALSLYAAPAAINIIAHGAVAPTPIVPFVGSSIIWLPSGVLNIPARVAVTATATFTHSFFLGVVATALSIVARMWHRRILGAEKVCSG